MTGSVGRDALPEGVRALAESTVDQTREAYDRSADAFEASALATGSIGQDATARSLSIGLGERVLTCGCPP